MTHIGGRKKGGGSESIDNRGQSKGIARTSRWFSCCYRAYYFYSKGNRVKGKGIIGIRAAKAEVLDPVGDSPVEEPVEALDSEPISDLTVPEPPIAKAES